MNPSPPSHTHTQVPSMITGAAQADAAVLVVAGSKGEFEGGFSESGQTKEHAILISSLGVKQLIVAVNKLDTVDWSQERYTFIQTQLDPFLQRLGLESVRGSESYSHFDTFMSQPRQKNITHIAYSCHEEIMTKTLTPTLEHRYNTFLAPDCSDITSQHLTRSPSWNGTKVQHSQKQ